MQVRHDFPANAPRFRGTVIAEKLLVVLLAAIAVGVLLDAGESRGAVLVLLIITYGSGLLAALRLRYRKRNAAAPRRTTGIAGNEREPNAHWRPQGCRHLFQLRRMGRLRIEIIDDARRLLAFAVGTGCGAADGTCDGKHHKLE